MKGTLKYSEYSCPCGGRINRKIYDRSYKLGFFKVHTILVYYYKCRDCGEESELYEIETTNK